jgi:hypothetical protein
MIKKRSLIQKIRQWEYWPFHWVYGPIYIIFAGYVVRSGFRFFFSASNPTIETGGFLMESKKKVYDLLPRGTYPPTIYFEPGVSTGELLSTMERMEINFPVIVKPDIGGRGRGVVIAKDEAELEFYINQYTLPFLVQPLVPLEQEAGVFFVRYPNQKYGKVTGIVGKSFGKVTGDGKHSIEQLIKMDGRLSLYMDSLAPQLGERLNYVPETGVVELLMPFGNHARGAAFFDWAHLIDDRLHQWANHLADNIEGFYFGRLDIRFNTWEELLENKNYSIIELNGAGSEPTHIYDSEKTIWYGWAEIIRHWHMMYKVSKLNHIRGVPYMSFSEGMKMFKDNSAYEKKLNLLHLQLLKKPTFEPKEMLV